MRLRRYCESRFRSSSEAHAQIRRSVDMHCRSSASLSSGRTGTCRSIGGQAFEHDGAARRATWRWSSDREAIAYLSGTRARRHPTRATGGAPWKGRAGYQPRTLRRISGCWREFQPGQLVRRRSMCAISSFATSRPTPATKASWPGRPSAPRRSGTSCSPISRTSERRACSPSMRRRLRPCWRTRPATSTATTR